MKYILTAIIASLFTLTACAKEEPVKAAPVVVEAAKEAPKTKRVCKDSKGKDGKVIKNKDGSAKQVCKTIKIHKKHEGTKVPDGKKK
jgi:nitrous oxide reductase accessory protein NosL